MTKPLAILLLASLLAACAPFPSDKNQIEKKTAYTPLVYQAVIDVDNLPSTEIIRRANVWAISAYNSYKDVLQYRDSSFLALNAIFELTAAEKYRYQLRIEAKEGRCRVTLDNYRDSEYSISLNDRESSITNITGSITNKQLRDQHLAENKLKYDRLDSQSAGIINDLKDALLQHDPEW